MCVTCASAIYPQTSDKKTVDFQTFWCSHSMPRERSNPCFKSLKSLDADRHQAGFSKLSVGLIHILTWHSSSSGKQRIQLNYPVSSTLSPLFWKTFK